MYEYKGKVISINLDGSIIIEIELGFDVIITQKLFLFGIDINRGKISTCISKAAFTSLNSMLLNKTVILKTHKGENITEFLADLYVETIAGLMCVNDILVMDELATYIN